MRNKLVIILISLAFVACKKSGVTDIKDQKISGVYEAIFIDVNSSVIDSTIDSNVLQEYKKLSNINLTNRSQFWGDKSNFMLRSLGVLKIDKEGEYFFKLTSTGKVNLQLNNVDLISHRELHEKESKSGKRILREGFSVFDFEYFPGDSEPYLVLEWSVDGKNFEVIPDEYYGSSELGATEPYVDHDTLKEEIGTINILSEDEKSNGWKLLFNGKSLDGWHTYNNPGTIGSRWIVDEGTLKFNGYPKYFTYYLGGRKFDHGNENKKLDGGLDIVTDESFENFDLRLEWKVSKYGNSGIFYTIQEIDEYDEGWKSSPEMQVLDDQGQKDGLIESHRAGDLYDLIPSSERRTKKHGEWNKVRILKNNGAVEHWLNNTLVLTYDTNSLDWKEMIKNSKFSEYIENFAKKSPGKIGLQDHGDEVWFRNIKIKEL